MILLVLINRRVQQRWALWQPSRCLNAKKGDSVTPGMGLIPENALTIKLEGKNAHVRRNTAAIVAPFHI
jgi:hypothetical protein